MDGSYSGSSSSTSGIGPVAFGARYVGGGSGSGLPSWTPLAVIGAVVLVAIVWLLKK